MNSVYLWSDVDPVILGECDGNGWVQVQLLGAEVGELLLLGLHGVQEEVDLLQSVLWIQIQKGRA